MDAYIDALAAFCALGNSSRLVGVGKPINGGFVTVRPRSPGSGAIAYVTWIASPWETAEGDLHTALLSTSIYGIADENARRGAIALANFLRGLDGDPVSLPGEAAALLAVETVTGPSLLPGNEFAYLVDALCNFQPS